MARPIEFRSCGSMQPILRGQFRNSPSRKCQRAQPITDDHSKLPVMEQPKSRQGHPTSRTGTPATRCVRSVKISTAESLRIFGESEAQSRCTSPTGAKRGLSSNPGGAARWLVMQNCSAALVSGAEPNKGFHQATIRFRISNPQVLSSFNRCIPHD
jgi:hypothetical protein